MFIMFVLLSKQVMLDIFCEIFVTAAEFYTYLGTTNVEEVVCPQCDNEI